MNKMVSLSKLLRIHDIRSDLMISDYLATPSISEVRKTLLQHELQQSNTPAAGCENGPTEFITLGLTIEDEQ